MLKTYLLMFLTYSNSMIPSSLHFDVEVSPFDVTSYSDGLRETPFTYKCSLMWNSIHSNVPPPHFILSIANLKSLFFVFLQIMVCYTQREKYEYNRSRLMWFHWAGPKAITLTGGFYLVTFSKWCISNAITLSGW